MAGSGISHAVSQVLLLKIILFTSQSYIGIGMNVFFLIRGLKAAEANHVHIMTSFVFKKLFRGPVNDVPFK